MWSKIALFIVKNKIKGFIAILIITIFFSFFIPKIQLNYDNIIAIPKRDKVYKDFISYKNKFGAEDELMLIGLDNPPLTDSFFFNKLSTLTSSIARNKSVKKLLSFQELLILIKNDEEKKFDLKKIFDSHYTNSTQLKHDLAVFTSLPMYKNIIYNPTKNSYLIAIYLDQDSMISPNKKKILKNIEKDINHFSQATNFNVYISGLTYIRNIINQGILKEMIMFLIISLILTICCLLLFFRSWGTVFLSLTVIFIGIVWALALIVLFQYKITILTALIPPLIVVIGIPNCIYFLNKYHYCYLKSKQKSTAIFEMISKMSVVTFTCNLSAAIGLGVFAFTDSLLLSEFGVVAGIVILSLFLISLFVIPTFLSLMKSPRNKQLKYLQNKWIDKTLNLIDKWTSFYSTKIIIVALIFLVLSIIGMFKLNSNGYVVDDLPKNNPITYNLKWFENHFGGILSVELIIDGRKSKAISRSISLAQQINQFNDSVSQVEIFGKPISYIAGIKYLRQAFYNNDSLSYNLPSPLELSIIQPYINNTFKKKQNSNNSFSNLIDSSQRFTRISIPMKDVGTAKLPFYIDTLNKMVVKFLDTSKIDYIITGGSITFLQGSNYIIKGLLESILWAFSLITLCMFILFRSIKVVFCSLIPNIIPLLMTAGLMGWAGIPLKPSTVLIFSVSLGIVIDITIRFLINFKQELKNTISTSDVVSLTLKQTGLSILYTSLALIVGFILFISSNFESIFNLGWLTSLTLLLGTITNLTLLPVLVNKFLSKKI